MKRAKPYFIDFLLIILSVTWTSAQGQTKLAFEFKSLEINGVPFNKNVNTIFKDSYGFLWIGTNTGLYQYDGNEIKEYQHNVFDENSIPNNSINSIIEDKNKNLWIGTNSFLVLYNRKKDAFVGYNKSFTFYPLLISSDGIVWANELDVGLYKIIPNQISKDNTFDTRFNYKPYNFDIFSNNDRKRIYAFVEDSFNRYWLATSNGIFSFEKEHSQATNFNKRVTVLKPYKKDSFLAVSNDTIYMLRYNNKNRNLEISNKIAQFLTKDLKERHITDLIKDKDSDNLWVGTTDGLFYVLPQTNHTVSFRYFCSQKNTPNTLNNNYISSLCYDDFDNLWIGSLNGLNKVLKKSTVFDFYHIDTEDHIENFSTESIFVDDKNNIWTSLNDKGLYRYVPKEKKYDKIKLDFENITGIVPSYNQKDWFLVGIQRLDKTNGSDFRGNQIKSNLVKYCEGAIKTVLPVSDDETWVGVWSQGLDIIKDHGTISQFKSDIVNQLRFKNISVMAKDAHDNIWIGTRGTGLYRINLIKHTFKTFEPIKTQGISSNAILCFYEDDKDFWVGTRGGGLMRYNYASDTFVSYGKEEGLSSMTVTAIQEDINGDVWVASNNGISRLDKNYDKFLSFGYFDGIKETSFAFNSSASNRDRSQLYFGCKDGFYMVNPMEFKQSTQKSKTIITNFLTLGIEEDGNSKRNKSTKHNTFEVKEIDLPYNKNNIAIEFSSLDFTAPYKITYAYMLDGLSSFWIYTDNSNRTAIYNDLEPGTYTFKVKSTNSDGIWNENPATITFKVNPPYWLSNIALIIYFLIAIMVLTITYYLIIRWYKLKKNIVEETIRHEKDNEHHRMKMVFFTDISHEFKTPLSLISGAIEKIQKEKLFNINPSTISGIKNNVDKMRSLINQIMDIRKFDAGEFKLRISKNNIISDIESIKSSFNDLADIYNIRFDLYCKSTFLEAWYDVDIFEKILFNLLSNAFKYTPKDGHIEISLYKIHSNDVVDDKIVLKRKGKHIRCTVKDNGVGIPNEELDFIFNRYYQSKNMPSNSIPGTGIGMELVQKLVDCHHGAIKVESKENIFTEFTFYLPIKKEHYNKNEFSKSKLKRDLPPKELKPKDTPTKTIVKGSRNASKVLLVEDNLEIRTMLKEELINDFDIIEASNGLEGYNMIITEAPQLIISDIMMPIKDGIYMLKKIKKNSKFNHIPIIMLTAKDSEDIKIKCLSLGADDYIEKPFSLEFVKWKVKNSMLSRRQLKEKYSKVITAEPSKVEIESHDEKFIKKLIKIIEDSIDDVDLNVESLAEDVGTSRSNLYRKLQAITNDSPSGFIKKIRLKRAAQLLREGNMYVSEIAYITGFNNQKYFSKCFQKEYGMNPTEYRKQYTETNNTTSNID